MRIRYIIGRKYSLKWLLPCLILIGIYTYSFIVGVDIVYNKICYWIEEISTYDTEGLRKRHHRRYREQFDIINTIKNIIPTNEIILINNQEVPPWFVAYYATPRQIYHYSDTLIANLRRTKQSFYILEMQQNSKGLKWSIIHYPDGVNIGIER